MAVKLTNARPDGVQLRREADAYEVRAASTYALGRTLLLSMRDEAGCRMGRASFPGTIFGGPRLVSGGRYFAKPASLGESPDAGMYRAVFP